METKKSRDADLERRRPQRFLLGLVMALALFFVALEWNSSDSGWTFFEADDDLEAELELEPLKRDADEIPMMLPQEKTPELPKSEQLRLVDDAVDTEIAEMPENTELQEIPEDPDQPEQAEVVDMYDEPVDIRVVEDLPQFPGGAAEFMKWLTKNLKYPTTAQNQRVKGRVVAEFIINKDGSVSDLQLVEHLNLACDNEVLRVLRMMPKWEPGVMNAKPCRTKVCIPVVFNL
jgi:protein TonB